MENMLLKAAVKAENVKNSVVDRVRNADTEENGDIVQTILIIALFVLIVVVVGTMLNEAISGQAKKVSDCISDSNSGACTDFKGKK